MDPSLKILFSLLYIPCTLFSTTGGNNSSLDNYRMGITFVITSMEAKIENQSGISNQLINHLAPQDNEKHLTSLLLTRVIPSLETFVIALSVPLNVMAILIFVIKIHPKKPALVYMLNLASADLFFAITLPFKVAYHFSGHNWVFGPGLCRFVTTTFFGNMYCSILLMMAISIDRFLGVAYPMQSLSWRTVRRANMVCLAIWIAAIAGMIPLLMTEQTKRIPHLNITTCLDMLDVTVTMKHLRYYFSALSVIFFFIPFIISTTCYVGIIRTLSSPNVAAKPGNRRRAILLSAAVLCTFILCFGPNNVIMLVLSCNHRLEWLYLVYMVTHSTGVMNSCIDPLIYYYASSKYKRQILNLLHCKKHSDPEICRSAYKP
ncbi:proteinase-activated receptor 1-like isoform X4 [Hemicordylus capensis]|uniref:proteinase-activated receptor 1-like isoform X4 n=1 Tax=Hemicordylus capensis TaxID=884348 RepID=UPI002302CF84|nr:proteinase-activated receptor 1-like isoform X4 [Hemicordylus capensis]